MDDNLSAVLLAKNDLQLLQRPKPKPGKNEVLLAMQKVGICGSDVHFLVAGCIGDYVVKEPMVLGHESSGVVAEVGEGVDQLKVGDRVAIEPGVPCRLCDLCKRGRYNLCPKVEFCATPPVHGTLARFFVHPADFCFKLPDHVSLEEGALLEPLSVAVHACKRAAITVGDTVFICGAGPIGLVNMLVAKAMGAVQVCITDISASRLEFAKSLGADMILLVTSTPEETAKEAESLLGSKFSKAIECSGVESSLRTAVFATQSAGTVVLVGMGSPNMSFPVLNSQWREVDIRGIFRYANCYGDALQLVASGKVNVKPLVTHRFVLEETLQAFETARTGKGGAVKVMIDCSSDSVN